METTQMVYIHGNYPQNSCAVEVKVTCMGSTVDEWIHSARSTAHCFQNIVGINCHRYPTTKPVTNIYYPATFGRKYECNKTKLATILHLCIDTKCLIIQMVYLDYIPQSLKDFLSDSSFIFVNLDVTSVVNELRGELGLTVGVTADIQALAVARWCSPIKISNRKPGLKTLAKSVVDLNIEKSMHDDNWSDYRGTSLTPEQIENDCTDVYRAQASCSKQLNGSPTEGKVLIK